MRVALVHPAEDMNEVAANALLKGLEEPPAGGHVPIGVSPACAAPADHPQPLRGASRAALPAENVAKRWLRPREPRMAPGGWPMPAARALRALTTPRIRRTLSASCELPELGGRPRRP